MGRIAKLGGALVVCAILPSTAAAQPPEPPTPALIERALEAGAIDDERANLLRVYALTSDARLPAAYESDTPWRGTALARQVSQELPRLERGPERRAIESVLRAPPDDPNPTQCFATAAGLTSLVTDHFYIQYNTIQGTLTIQDYADSLEEAWDTEVETFGWAAPPIDAELEGKYHVIIGPLGPALYGFVSTDGTYAGEEGDNPNTTWDDADAQRTCMGLNTDYSAFPGSPQQALDATTAHEFHHSLQYGLGALTGGNAPDLNFSEGGATWMEDEVQDAADDNYNYLYPAFDDSMGEHDEGDEYAYWLTFRGLTERFGTNTAGAGEQVMQDFWERISRFPTEGSLTALNQALVNKGSNLAGAYHDYAIAAKPMRSCGGAIALPFCFAEATGYVTAAGPTDVHESVSTVGDATSGTVEDNYTLNWVSLPIGSYSLTLSKPATGGALRATVVCATATQLLEVRLAAPLTGTGSATVPGLNTAGCTTATLVITNESQTGGDPTASAARAYRVTTDAAPASTNPTELTPTSGTGTPPSGSPGGQTTGPATDATDPVLSQLSLSRRRFRAFGSGPGISARRGTRLRYRLSELATVRVRLQRRNRAGRWITVRGSGIDRGVKGVNSFRFSGRWRRRRLALGVYRLRLRPTDGARNVGRVRTTRPLRIVRR